MICIALQLRLWLKSSLFKVWVNDEIMLKCPTTGAS